MKKLLLTFVALFAAITLSAQEKVKLTDMSFYVFDEEQIDEDGDFRVIFYYKLNVLDESVMASGTMTFSVLDAEGNTVIDKEPWTFSAAGSACNLYLSGLEGGKTYTIKADEIVVKDNSVIDWETVFTGEEILRLTEGLPSLTFTPIAGEVRPVDVKSMSVTCDKNALLDEEGNYTLTFNYTGQVNDGGIQPENLTSLIKYQVYDTDFNFITAGSCAFNLTGENAQDVTVSGLEPGKSYVFMVTGLVVTNGDTEVLNLSDDLPKLTFKVKDPNGPQAIMMTDMSFTVAEGAELDQDGDFRVTFNYSATINDPSAVTFGFATVSFDVFDAEGKKVCNSLSDFDFEYSNSKNIYIADLKPGQTYTIVATMIEIQDFMSMEMLCEMSTGLPSLTFTVGGASGIERAQATAAKSVSKVLRDGKVVIIRDGKVYGVNALQLK